MRPSNKGLVGGGPPPVGGGALMRGLRLKIVGSSPLLLRVGGGGPRPLGGAPRHQLVSLQNNRAAPWLQDGFAVNMPVAGEGAPLTACMSRGS